MQNGIVLEDNGPYKAGDLIISTPNESKSARRDVGWYHISEKWPQLKEGLTVWLHGDSLGECDSFTMRNGSDLQKPWPIKSATFRNVPGTIVKCKEFNIMGLVDCKVIGDVSPFNVYQTGRYGMHALGDFNGGHGFEISVLDGGSVELSGFEAEKGFSAVRLNGFNYKAVAKSLKVSDFYIHDTIGGEGFYIGSTQAPPYTKFQNVEICNGYIIRTAGEAIQFQHGFGDVDIHNVQVYCADIGWLKMFKANQSSAIQWLIDGGQNNKLHHIIIDGFCQGMICQGGHDAAPEGSTSLVSDILFRNGYNGMYLHKSMSKGVSWCFERIHYREFSELFSETTGNKPVDNIISNRNGTDDVLFDALTFDGTRQRMFEKVEDWNDSVATKVDREPPLKYFNSGFPCERANQIREWHQFLGGYHPICKSGAVQIPTKWCIGDIARSCNPETKKIRFFKCVFEHTATEVRPENNPEFFLELYWDVNGVRRDQDGFNIYKNWSYLPPDDMRLSGKWKELGVPYRENIIDRFIQGENEYIITDFRKIIKPL